MTRSQVRARLRRLATETNAAARFSRLPIWQEIEGQQS